MADRIVRDLGRPALAGGQLYFEERQRASTETLSEEFERLEWYDAYTFFDTAQEQQLAAVLGQAAVGGNLAFGSVVETPEAWFIETDHPSNPEVPGYGWSDVLEAGARRAVTLVTRSVFLFRRLIIQGPFRPSFALFLPIGVPIHPQQRNSVMVGNAIKIILASTRLPDPRGDLIRRDRFNATTFRELPP